MGTLKAKIRNTTAPAHTGLPGGYRETISPQVEQLLKEFRLEDVTSHLLRRAHFLAEDLFAQEFAAESITPRQKAVLIAVYQEPGLNQNALADRLHMDRNTVAEMVRRLVKAGRLQRDRAPEDQRAYRLYLTDQGGRVLDHLLPRDIEVEQQLLDRLPAEYRLLFIKCLKLLVES